MHRFLAAPLALSLTILPAVSARADDCRIDAPGVRCATATTSVARLAPGAALPASARLLFNPEYYGLPPVNGHWRYYHADGEVYRVEPEGLTVIEAVIGGNRALF